MRRVLRGAIAAAAIAFGIVGYVYLTLPDVRALATINPTTTAFMRLRAAEAVARRISRPIRMDHRDERQVAVRSAIFTFAVVAGSHCSVVDAGHADDVIVGAHALRGDQAEHSSRCHGLERFLEHRRFS